MYCRALACDFDGTGASNDRLAPEVAAALGAARAQGIVTLLVTGRVLEDLDIAGVDLASFDAVVAENGAVVHLPGSERTIQLGTPPSEHFLGELRARGVPLQAGAVVVSTWDRHATEVLNLIRQFGIDGQLIFNRAAMMLLPSGVNKAVGARRALEELQRSERNLIAFGDAENDHPLLTMAEVGIAARGSVPAIAAAADDRLTQPGPAGVARYVQRLLAQGGTVPTPARHRIVLGHDSEGAEVALPASGINVMVSGDPREGKSWLAGLAAERLLERGYRLCLIDPEGDHLSLGQRPRILVLGHDLPLPAPEVVPRVLRDEQLSVVLNLAGLAHATKIDYVDAVLCALEQARAVTGIPHWTVIDEAQYFFHESAPSCRHFESRTGNYVFVTHRPSLVSSTVYACVQAHLILHTAVEEERYFMTSLLQARGPHTLAAPEALAAIGPPRAGLLLEDAPGPRWQVFTPGARVSPHVHHGRKYADTQLPERMAFHFQSADGAVPAVAHNVLEFCDAVRAVPLESLRHHLRAGDFSRWAASVLGDAELAAGLRKLEHTATLTGATPSRDEILGHVKDRYLL